MVKTMVRTINTLIIETNYTENLTKIFVKNKKSFKISKKSKLFLIKSTNKSEIYFPLIVIKSISFKRKWMYKGKWKLSEEQVSF